MTPVRRRGESGVRVKALGGCAFARCGGLLEYGHDWAHVEVGAEQPMLWT